MTADAVRCTGVGRRFGATPVLDGLDLAIAPGERVAITGANGSGKTTLLRLVAGVLRPDAGEVRVLGGSPRSVTVRARTGFLAHRPHLYPRLTGAENIRFWGRLHGDPGDPEPDLLRQVGLEPDDPRPAGAYSEGMRRRLGFACALVHGPELLLCDEPFAALDPDGTAAVGALLEEGGRTVLCATHEVERAPSHFHRVLTLDRGRLIDRSAPTTADGGHGRGEPTR